MATGSTTSLTFDLLAKDKTASRTFERFGRTVDDTDSKMRKIGSTMATVGKTAAAGLAVGVAAAGVALVAFGKSAVEEAREAQKVAGQTEAVIKSTGQAANVTAEQVANLAEKLSLKAGIDDELIQSGENVLLTFTNIRNEVGKGNDIFNQATTTALDMSVALGKDMKSASILVGKALHDPVAGLSALTRVGVQFTEQQKVNIEKLVEEGKVLKAQKIILGELDKKFAGSAAAQATAGEKAKVAWENFQEEIGRKLLPLLDKLAVFFINDVVPALRQFSGWFQREAIPVIKKFATQGQELLNKFVAWVREHWPEIKAVIVDVLDTIVENWKATVAIITRIWQKWGDDLFRILGPILQNIGTQIRAALKILRGIFDVFAGLLQGDWGRMWDGFKQIFGGAWDSLKGNIKTQVKVLKAIFESAWDAIKDVFEGVWDGIKKVLTKAWQGIKTYYGTQFKLLKMAFSKAWDAIKAVFGIAWDGIKTLVTDRAIGVKDFFARMFTETIPGIFKRAWEGIKNIFKSAWTALNKFVREGIAEIVDKFLSFIEWILNAADKAFGWIPGIGPKLDAAVKDFQNFKEGVNAQIRGIDSTREIRLETIAGRKFQALIDSGAGHPAWTGNRAMGGPIYGGVAGKDSVPIMAMPGEHVWTTREVQAAGGHGAMKQMRNAVLRGQVQGMAVGGAVQRQKGVYPNLVGEKAMIGKFAKAKREINQFMSQVVMFVDASKLFPAGRVGAALRWARKQVGDEYRLGAVGPNAWDCSGFMSGIVNFLRGKPLHSRVGTTATFPWPGFVRGADPKGFTIGSTPHYPGSSLGHMAGTLGGVNVESSGGVGVRVGRGARGYRDPGFTQVYHLTGIKGGGGGLRGGDTGALSAGEKYIIRRESGFRVNANNPSSSAFGLGQLLEANRIKYARRLGFNAAMEQGDTGTTNWAHQVAMFRAYYRDRYGGIGRAVAFHKSHGWYGNGLDGGIFTRPTVIGVGDKGPERVDVTPLRGGRQGSSKRIEFVITNWQSGEGYIAGIAREEMAEEFKFMGSAV